MAMRRMEMVMGRILFEGWRWRWMEAKGGNGEEKDAI